MNSKERMLVTLKMLDYEKVDKIIAKYKNEKNALIGLLQDISAEFNYLPEQVICYVSQKLEIPLSQLYSLSTFYKTFRLNPPGKHHICVCTGTACHVRGASKIVETLEQNLQIKVGQTTQDGNFSLETVNCLGACALGPLVTIDTEYYGNTLPNKLQKILEKYEDKKS